MHLYLIRHAQSLGNLNLDPSCDCPLSDPGRAQARALASWMHAHLDLTPFTGIVSPYTRARETAAIITTACHLPFTVDDACREWGKPCTINGHTYPEESLPEVAHRLHNFLARLDPTAKYVIVSHATPIFMLAHLATGHDPAATLAQCTGDFWSAIHNCHLTEIQDGKLLCLSRDMSAPLSPRPRYSGGEG